MPFFLFLFYLYIIYIVGIVYIPTTVHNDRMHCFTIFTKGETKMNMMQIEAELNSLLRQSNDILLKEGVNSFNYQNCLGQIEQLRAMRANAMNSFNPTASYVNNSSSAYTFQNATPQMNSGSETYTGNKFAVNVKSKTYDLATEPIKAFTASTTVDRFATEKTQQPISDTSKPALGHEFIFATHSSLSCKKEVSGVDNTYKYEIYGDLDTVENCDMAKIQVADGVLTSLNDVELEMLGNNVDYLACKIEDTNYREIHTSIDNIKSKLHNGSFHTGEFTNIFSIEHNALSHIVDHYTKVINLALKGALRSTLEIENIGEDISALVNRVKNLSIDKKTYFNSIQACLEDEIRNNIEIGKTKYDGVKSIKHRTDALVISNDDIIGNLLVLLSEHEIVSLRQASNPYLYSILEQYTQLVDKNNLPIVIYVLTESQGFAKLVAIRDTYNNFVISNLNV